MIKKLQLKFVLICMASLLAVLTVIIAGMNAVSYGNVVHEADELLALLSENKGRFPALGAPGNNLPPHMSPEVPFETRYFTVTTDRSTGHILQIDTGRIAAVNSEEARRFVEHVKGDHGFVRHYRYLRSAEGEETKLIFLDCGRQLKAWQSFLIASIAISLVGYLLVFALVLFLSNRVARPFVENYKKQKEFITNAGHELKTPLTIIRADADVLEMELGKNEWLEDIQKQTQRLSDLTADLIFLSRAEEARGNAAMLPFPISDVVTETAQSFLAPAQTQGKQLSLHITPMLSANGDSKAISQLVSILLDNALKYSPEKATIQLTLEKQGKFLCLSVTNHSSQALPKDLSQLFDRFYRGDSARSTQGHGIGLSVASAISGAHGGRISASLTEEKALCITVQLPA